MIPARLLVRAPGRPRGHRLLGFAEDGSCPMFAAGACSIYARRPRTCRDYDCRMFAAAGFDAGDGKDVINERVAAWVFTYESERERRAHDAIRAAAAFIRERRDSFPGGAAPRRRADIAVLALKVYTVFLDAPPRTLPTPPRRSSRRAASSTGEARSLLVSDRGAVLAVIGAGAIEAAHR